MIAPSPSRLARIDAQIDAVWRAKWAREEYEARDHEKYELVWEQRALAEVPIHAHIYEQRNGLEFAKWCGDGVIWKWSRDRMPEEIKVSGEQPFWFMEKRPIGKPCTCEVCVRVRERRAFVEGRARA